MLTAMQMSKIRTSLQLIEARDSISDRLSQMCLSKVDRRNLHLAIEHIDAVVDNLAPSNDGPPAVEGRG